VTFKDVDYLEKVARISEKDDVIATGKTARIRREFRSCPSNMTGRVANLARFRWMRAAKSRPASALPLVFDM
jgi:hypothetical protein